MPLAGSWAGLLFVKIEEDPPQLWITPYSKAIGSLYVRRKGPVAPRVIPVVKAEPDTMQPDNCSPKCSSHLGALRPAREAVL